MYDTVWYVWSCVCCDIQVHIHTNKHMYVLQYMTDHTKRGCFSDLSYTLLGKLSIYWSLGCLCRPVERFYVSPREGTQGVTLANTVDHFTGPTFPFLDAIFCHLFVLGGTQYFLHMKW